MKLAFSVILLSMSLCPIAVAQTQLSVPTQLDPPKVPVSIALPAGHAPFFRVHAKGFQNYTCAKTKDVTAWTLTGPEAQLFDDHSKEIGTHYTVQGLGPGPSPAWKLIDGSEIVGEKVAASDSPDYKDISWLLLKVVINQKRGILADAAYVQRVYTRGGKPSASGCTAETLGDKTRSEYTAEYYFAK